MNHSTFILEGLSLLELVSEIATGLTVFIAQCVLSRSLGILSLIDSNKGPLNRPGVPKTSIPDPQTMMGPWGVWLKHTHINRTQTIQTKYTNRQHISFIYMATSAKEVMVFLGFVCLLAA